jgi:hypothetical protein
MNVNIYLPDDLGERVKNAELEISRICQAALLREVERYEAQTAARRKFKYTRIEVEVGNPKAGPLLTKAFEGHWLVKDFNDMGNSYSVALTKKGQLAIFHSHDSGQGYRGLDVYKSVEALEKSFEGLMPEALLSKIASGLGTGGTVELDI